MAHMQYNVYRFIYYIQTKNPLIQLQALRLPDKVIEIKELFNAQLFDNSNIEEYYEMVIKYIYAPPNTQMNIVLICVSKPFELLKPHV